jgi:ribosomal protein S18 acetylase RimI-like enzyme
VQIRNWETNIVINSLTTSSISLTYYLLSKENPIHIRLLVPSDLNQFYFTFQEAFDDYSVDIRLDRKAFDRRMLDKLGIDWALSVGAFSGDKMIGFIAHTANKYQNQHYAYNGGTGVIPEYRGLSLTEHMYALAIRQMRDQGIDRCVLEVIDHNRSAINAYSKVGFRKTRILKCYKLTNVLSTKSLQTYESKVLTIDDIRDLPDTTFTSFMDTWDQLARNIANARMILHRDHNDALIGYCVFQPDNGRVARLWVRQEDRRHGVGKSLLLAASGDCSNRPLTAINVDSNDEATHHFLIACGFENQIDQWEMILQID